jgi:hypothetical protein
MKPDTRHSAQAGILPLNWRSLVKSHDPRFLVKGTEIGRALFAGARYAIYEIRTLEADRMPGLRYAIRDAHLVSDAEVKEGKRPPVIFRSDDWLAAQAECARLLAEWAEAFEKDEEAD